MVNVIKNPGFDTTTEWYFNIDGTVKVFYIKDGMAEINLQSPGIHNQLAQWNVPLEPNTAYTLKFDAYSVYGKGLEVHLIKQVSPFTNYGLLNVVSLSTSSKTYTINFRTMGFSVPVTDARFMFYFNKGSDVYYIDNVILEKTTTPPITSSAHWAFEETSGTTIVDSSGTNNGSIYGGTTRVPGVIGNALKFDGINGYAYVSTNELPSGLSPRSISAWVNVSAYTPESYIFFYGTAAPKNAFYITVSGSEVRGGAWDYGIEPTYPNFFKNLNQWYHVCLTYDGSTAILYGNGIELARKTISDWNLILSSNGGYINKDYKGSSPLKGSVDEVKVFNKTLTPSEVLQEYNIVPKICTSISCTLTII